MLSQSTVIDTSAQPLRVSSRPCSANPQAPTHLHSHCMSAEGHVESVHSYQHICTAIKCQQQAMLWHFTVKKTSAQPLEAHRLCVAQQATAPLLPRPRSASCSSKSSPAGALQYLRTKWDWSDILLVSLSRLLCPDKDPCCSEMRSTSNKALLHTLYCVWEACWHDNSLSSDAWQPAVAAAGIVSQR